MPVYCYVTQSGKSCEWTGPMGQAPAMLDVDGEVATRDFRAELVGVPSTSGWPLECVASGVNAADADKLREEFKKHGLSVRVSEDGNPIYENAEQRKRALKARGFFDRASYYG